MSRVRWPVAVAAALLLSAGSIQAAREGLNGIAAALLVLGAVLLGAWIVFLGRDD